MKQFSKDLGNVSLAPKGKWSREQEYERLALVYNACDNLSYVAKTNVPSGVDIDNREYWQPMNATGYADNNFINLTIENENGTITAYESIEEAVATILPINRRAGATLSFYNLNADRLDRQAEFELWQFNSTDLANWENKDYWNNIYYNWNVFVGWYIGADALKNHVEIPNVGQYAYVGSNLNDALLYQCRTNGTWTNTGIKVRNYISVVVSGNITIGENGNWFSDGEDTGIPATPSVDEQLDNIITKHESLSRTVQGIAATGGASTANNVTYNNDASGLNAENAQDAIDELQGSKIDKTSILQEAGNAEDKVMSQGAVKAELDKKADKAALQPLITNISKNYVFAGIANLTTNPGTPDGNVFYLASHNGVYPNFGIEIHDSGLYAFTNKAGGTWAANRVLLGHIYNTLFKSCYYSENYNGSLILNNYKGTGSASCSSLLKFPTSGNIAIYGAAHTGLQGYAKVPTVLFFDKNLELISFMYNTTGSSNFTLTQSDIPSSAVFFAIQFISTGGNIKYESANEEDVYDTGINVFIATLVNTVKANSENNTRLINSLKNLINNLDEEVDNAGIQLEFNVSNLELNTYEESTYFGMIFDTSITINEIKYISGKAYTGNKIVICDNENTNDKSFVVLSILDIPDAVVGENTISDLNLRIKAGNALFILGNDRYTKSSNFSNVKHSVGISGVSKANVGDTVTYIQKLTVQKAISVIGIQSVPITEEYIEEIVQNNIKSEMPNYLNGKILSVTGDSEAAGHSIGKQNTYGALIAARNGMTINNYAINGRKLITGAETSLVDTYTEIAENSDYILVQIGYNDNFNAGVDDNNKDTKTFKGAFNILVEGLQSNYPKAKIGFIEPYYFGGTSLKPRAAWIKERCEFYHIQCIDGTAKSGLRKDCTEQADYFIDSVHLTVLGHKRMSYIYENFLRGL